MNFHLRLRFIPAGAGNTILSWLNRQAIAVYPRWRGEHMARGPGRGIESGLSPLARGTHTKSLSQLIVSRFIPADAGNTIVTGRPTGFGTVYPRWRGEHESAAPPGVLRFGLSPLARGTRLRIVRSTFCSGFIPAGAGNTPPGGFRPGPAAVYPRWRGEHMARGPGRGIESGLSPLARGTPTRHATSTRRVRFIPAGAGNTTPSRPGTCRAPVYPRWRGEHQRAEVPEAGESGLSPLARGTPQSHCAVER
ncbi:Domain of uncharacterised function (DUF2825) [Klebsiella pneumoniae]|nr:Domain of uncharacterised function (DUF2825) [Klebsiella pneumoniae]